MNWKKFAGVLVILLMLVCGIEKASATYYKRLAFSRISGTAGESLSVGDVVCFKDADGYVYKADANDSTLRPAIGIIGVGASSGSLVEIVTSGVFSGWSSLTEGAVGYLSETAGAITQTAPTSFQQAVAIAISTTEYSLMISDSTYNISILGTIIADITLDDGSGASPSLIFTDQNNQSATFSKTNDSYITLTTEAADGLQILTGSLKVGNGTPGQTINGEDLYVEGIVEIDGAVTLDGALTTNSTITAVGNVTLDDGSGASPSLTLTDATDETAVFSKADAGYLSLTTDASDGLNILTGSLKIGNGTPGQTINGEDFYCEGISEFDGSMYLDGAVTAANTVTLDDGSGASPSFVMTDETNESATFSKVDAGYLTITTTADDGLQILTGNLKIGNGTPGQTIDGEDLYVEGIVEIDGAVTLDGALTTNSTITAVGNVTLDDGSGASPNLTLTDATNETAVFSKADTGYLSITTDASDGLQVLTGSLKIGNGTPDQTINGEDLYCEGISEFDGSMYIDGAVTAANTITAANTVTLDDGTGASPSFVMQDATDETATFSKADAGYLTITTTADDGVQVTTGNLRIGNGTASQTLDGEDFYCEGLSEFAGNMYLDDGSGASPSLTFIDATNETAVFSKADTGYLSVTTDATDGLQVLTGSLKVGNGTPVQTIDGEDAYIEGDVEIAGVLYASGGIQYEGTDNALETTIAFTDPVNDATLTMPNWTGDVPVVVSTDYADHSATNQTTDGTSVTVPDAVLVAGKSLRFKLSGTCTGANANKSVILYIDDSAIITLSTDDTTDVGDWTVEFVLMASGSATQRVTGSLIMAAAAIVTTDYATDTTNFSDGSTTTVKTQVVSGNAGDTIAQTMCVVEFLP